MSLFRDKTAPSASRICHWLRLVREVGASIKNEIKKEIAPPDDRTSGGAIESRTGQIELSTESRLLDNTTELLPVPLACQGRLEAGFLAWGNEEGMPLHFPNDVLLLDFPLEAPKGAFERFIISEPNLCQRISPAFRMVPPGRPVLLVSIHTGGETLPTVPGHELRIMRAPRLIVKVGPIMERGDRDASQTFSRGAGRMGAAGRAFDKSIRRRPSVPDRER